MSKKMYLGLDIGTSSVGWALTDEEYNLCRLKGKTAWGSRIFSEAKSKQDTRAIRSNRRRMNRREHRLHLLETLFAEEINKIDNTFFIRLDNASYLLEDKVNKGIGKNLIFKNKNEEKEFYKKYPTIWHLRKALIEADNDAISDLRQVYLAIHHIMKYRGNFLIDGEFSLDEKKLSDGEILLKKLLSDLNNHLKAKLNENEIDSDIIKSTAIEQLKDILLDNETNKKTKQKQINDLFVDYKLDSIKENIKMFVVIVTGGKYSNKNLDVLVDFTAKYDDDIEKIKSELQDDFIIVDTAKQIYDFVQLKKLIGDNVNISNVMVSIYKEHKKQLKMLKDIVIDIDKNANKETRVYDDIFKNKKMINYASLVHVGSELKRSTLEDFNIEIAKKLKANEEFVSEENKENYNLLINLATEKQLLKLIAHVSTGIIPHQLHFNELKKIIDNAAKVYPFISEIKEKLVLLFKYRVHYSYGPLDSRSQYSNIEKNPGYENVSITPWNINEVINDNKTKEKFMNKLTNNCSYLYGEKVLPKASLDFESYVILDKLNVMFVNNNFLNKTEKEEVYNYIIGRNKTTLAQLRKFLANRYNCHEKDIIISKIKEDVVFEARSHVHLVNDFDLVNDKQQVEYYIYLATIYADDRKMLQQVLKEQFKHLSEHQIKRISSIPTNKWASLSSKLLTGLYYTNNETGEVLSILQAMHETNYNLQQLLAHSTYRFIDLINEHNREKKEDKTTEDIVNELLENTPSITRRSINQTLLIIEDIKKASNKEIDKIFVEVTRNDDDKKKGKESISRYNEINNFLTSIAKDIKESKLALANIDVDSLKEELEELDQIKLKSKHIYLYFKQMGIDMYTGEKINISDVINGNKYDIDHIIPQSLIKDDSVDNMVLVNKETNERIKQDKYPIPLEIKTSKVISVWKYLYSKNAISEKKYANLMRNSEITVEELENFVARQINVVDYANKVIKDILKLKYPNTDIVFSKSQYPSFIRKELEIIKNRDVNDAHHAIDAYLNVFCGNVLSTTFSNVYQRYNERFEKGKSKTFNMERVLKNKLESNDSLDNLYSKKIFNNCMRHDILVTFKCDYNNGAFYDATLYPKTNKTLIPIHSSEDNPIHDVTKYGGYSGMAQAYLLALEYTEKNKVKKIITRVPILLDRKYGNDLNELAKHVLDNKKLTNIKVLRKIALNQKIKFEEGIYLLYTNNEIQHKYKMAYQNYIDNEILKYLHFANKKIDELDATLETQEFIVNRKKDVLNISKEHNQKIFNRLINISQNNVYRTCNYIRKLQDITNDDFEALNIKEQIETLNTIIACLSRNNEQCKFNSKLVSAPKTCSLKLAYNITDKNISLIYESPTGLFSHEVKL